MDHSTLVKVIEESAWRRQWFRLQYATLCLKKAFWFRAWQTGVTPLQVAEAHDTLLVHASTVSVQVTWSSKRVRSFVKQARQQWMERQVTEIAAAAEKGNLKPLYQFCKKHKNWPQSCYVALSAIWSSCDHSGVAAVWRHHFAKNFDHHIRMVPFESLARSLQQNSNSCSGV